MTRYETLILIFLSLLSSCDSKQNLENFFDKEGEKQRQILAANHITKKTEILIRNDSLKSINLIEKILYFNDHGLCTLAVSPHYEYRQSLKKGKGPVSIDDLEIDGRTNNYLGFNDSTFYEYDKSYRLIKIVNVYQENLNSKFRNETVIEYDEHGNEVSSCFSTETTPISCEYRVYDYSKNGKIVSRKDSFDYEVYLDFSKPHIYKYDKSGNLTFDGDEYIYDDQGRVIEILPYYSQYSGKKIKYDNEGRKIEEIQTHYPNDRKVLQVAKPVIYYKYDSRNLIVEKKEVSGGKVLSLTKYHYE